MKIHELKTWLAQFGECFCGLKPFEVRVNDRDYKVGDYLQLKEFDPNNGYTGRYLMRRITYIFEPGKTSLPLGISDNIVIMAVEPV